jgi:Tol biopolymer transport system component
MSKRDRYVLILSISATAALAGLVFPGAFGSSAAADQAVSVGRSPRIQPDYADTVIPPNIAPLNFLIREDGARYLVRIRSERGASVEIASRSPKVAIPLRQWRRLLSASPGRQLAFDVFAQSPEGASRRWRRFDSFHLTVAPEAIDNYLVYRRIHPGHSAWRDMGIYQRDLRSFRESTILTNDYFRSGCVNCHTFLNHRTETMLVSTRSGDYGNSAVIVKDGQIDKVGATFGYASWHPSGDLLVYTSMRVALFHHAAAEEARDVIDMDSLLAYYDTRSKTVRTAPDLAKKERLETYPTWSPDGRYLYFCSAPLTWTRRDVIPDGYNEIKYDLVRVAYDADQGTWGQVETVLSAQETGRSILVPRISPDGRWLLATLSDYGCFPAYRRDSNLYLVDREAAAKTGRYEPRPLPINSDRSESWHSWSSNSRWIAFSSKRDNGTFTRTYLSYIDPSGTAHKPFVLPQKDPTYYDSCLWTYSVPELVTQPVRTRKETLGRVIRGARRISVEMPVTMATPQADTAPQADLPYLSTRE